MSLTAVQQILNEIGARLENITIANGYDFDIVKVVKRFPFQALAFQTEDIPAIFFFPSGDIRIGAEHRIAIRQITVTIGIYYSSNDSELIDLAEQIGSAIHIAIHRATTAPLMTDNTSSDLGGLVNSMDLNLKLPLVSEEMRPWYGAQFEYIVEYETVNGDPFTLI